MHESMIRDQIVAAGIRDPRVIDAMARVPRHLFVPEEIRRHSYEDTPLAIGEGQTISQPYIVALMTELARIAPGDRVLEVGTGSGYQSAILAAMGADLHTIEIRPGLAAAARAALEGAGFPGIAFRVGDGYRGWPEAAPFGEILVTAAPGHVPPALVEQLRPGGRLVIPVGGERQELRVITRTESGPVEETIAPVRFVPMTGEAQERKAPLL